MDTDIQKFRVIFRWIAENIEYDIKLYLQTVSHDYDPKIWPHKAARWSKRLNRLYTKHTVKQRISICEGYAWLLESMCRTVGISCEVIPGYARNENSDIGRKFKPNHAWNAVKINNKWYLSDPTWAAGGVNPQFTRYIKNFNEIYFLVNPDDFIANHYPSEIRWILLLEKPGLTDFFNAPIKTTAFLENRMVHYFPDTGKNYINRDSLFNFSFTLNQRLESFFAEAITYRNKQSITEILPEVPKLNKEGYYCISHAFEKKGEYDLRIYINDRLTFIYKVFVR